MPTSYKEFRLNALTGGLFLDPNPSIVPAGGWIRQNEFQIRNGALLKYPGWSEFLDTEETDPVIFGFDFIKLDQTPYFLCATKEKLFYYNRGTELFELLNILDEDEPILFTGSNYDRWIPITINDKVYLLNGVDHPHFLTTPATGLKDLYVESADLTCPTSARYGVNFVNHLMLANVTEQGNEYRQRIRWSDIDNPLVWTPVTGEDANEANFIDIGEVSDQINGIALSGPLRMVVYKSLSLHVCTYEGLPTIINVKRVASDDGLAAPYSLVTVAERHFFKGHRDFYLFDGASIPVPLGANRIRDNIFGDIQSLDQRYIYGVSHPRYPEVWWVYVSRTSTTGFDKAVIYNWQEDKWYTRDNFNQWMVTPFKETTELTVDEISTNWDVAQGTFRDKRERNRDIIVSGSPDGKIMLHGFSNTGGSLTIDGMLETGDITFDTKIRKRIKFGIADIERYSSGDIIFQLGVKNDFDSQVSWYSPVTVDSESRIALRGVGKVLRLRIIAKAQCAISGITLYWEPAGER